MADTTVDPIAEFEQAARDWATAQGWTPPAPSPPVTPPPAPTPPAVPTGLTASPVWDPDCVECGNVAVPTVELDWDALPAGVTASVYRDGVAVQSGVAENTWTDCTTVSGQTYAYSLTATANGLESAPCAPVSVVSPSPPAVILPPPPVATGPALGVPTNLAAHGFWDSVAKKPSDTLTWDAASGAVAYNVYRYGVQIGKGIKDTTYTVPSADFQAGVTYTVTSLDSMGMESLPSNQALAFGGYDMAHLPSWISATPATPVAPHTVTAVPEWNNGAPRIAVAWQGGGDRYSVYRDGKRVATDLWTLTYFDSDVKPGEAHSYAVASVYGYVTPEVEGPQSAAASAAAPSAAPAALAQKVTITRTLPGDDSAMVFFKPVPGAADYRIYDVSNPNSVKYCGLWVAATQDMIAHVGTPPLPMPSEFSIQWNGIDPAKGANLVVEAVDKLGPFQAMDGMAGPGTMQMDGSHVSTNGQGDPSNVPNVLCASDPVHVDCVPFTLSGSQVFLDNFRNPQPLIPSPLPAELAAINKQGHPRTQQENDKWIVRTYEADDVMTKVFFMGNHAMDTLYDGPYAGHNNNASVVWMPKATGDISGGKVLHVHFKVDAHMDGRRWWDLFVGEAGDVLTMAAPTKLDPTQLPTVRGNLLVWQIQNAHALTLITPKPGTPAPGNVQTDLIQPANATDGAAMDRSYWHQHFTGIPSANGSPMSLDKQSTFDFYLSQTHYRLVETLPDGVTQIVREKDFPAGVTLPFTNCQVYFVHELYHTGNERPDTAKYYAEEQYWVNYRPWSDERHYDDLGFCVLGSFPPLPAAAK